MQERPEVSDEVPIRDGKLSVGADGVAKEDAGSGHESSAAPELGSPWNFC
jgi:hypothetical protein